MSKMISNARQFRANSLDCPLIALEVTGRFEPEVRIDQT